MPPSRGSSLPTLPPSLPEHHSLPPSQHICVSNCECLIFSLPSRGLCLCLLHHHLCPLWQYCALIEKLNANNQAQVTNKFTQRHTYCLSPSLCCSLPSCCHLLFVSLLLLLLLRCYFLFVYLLISVYLLLPLLLLLQLLLFVYFLLPSAPYPVFGS